MNNSLYPAIDWAFSGAQTFLWVDLLVHKLDLLFFCSKDPVILFFPPFLDQSVMLS